MTDSSLRQRKRVLRRANNLNESKKLDMDHDSYDSVKDTRQQRGLNHVRKKIEALTCSVCESLAHGYNFDAITCESCKAFFRRNALKADVISKCRINNGKCVITISTRKRCKACRLAKCFEKGMRADWILTDEERLNKQQKIEENRRLRRILYPDSSEADEKQICQTSTEPFDYDNTMTSNNGNNEDSHAKNSLHESSSSILSSNDLIQIQQIQQAYNDSIRLTSLSSEFPSYPQALRITDACDLFNFLTNVLSTRLITFLKLLPEFSSLNSNDKFILIKYNTLTLTFIRAALNYNPNTDVYHEPQTDECILTGYDIAKSFSIQQYNLSSNCLKNLLKSSFNDRLILQLLLIVVAFSKGSSICATVDEMEPLVEDILTIYQIQNIFVDLLWKYCEQKFGREMTVQIWLNLTVYTMDAHLQAYNSRHGDVKVNSIADQLSPLVRSVLILGEI
ncbi:hypothetical protein I4U23_007680 [Adineta vaga]|nr:hypothetical protein I4U23_007680 [Adineta vaga]